MKVYNCIIVDDEPIARDIIISYSQHLSALRITATCGNALEAKKVLEQSEADIIFLDINMPVLNGIAFLKTLRNPPQVIFTTAYREYAVDAFDLSAVDYLLKPFSMERFMMAVDKAIEKIESRVRTTGAAASGSTDNKEILAETTIQLKAGNVSGNGNVSVGGNTPGRGKSDNAVFLKADGKIYKLVAEEILYAEASGNYSKIVTADFSIMPAMSFTSLVAILSHPIFFRVHRSYLINKQQIRLIEGNRIFIRNYEIPIGNSYKDDFIKELGL
jgi:DNA-binding LytR/AlgR family response regulator